MRNDETPPSRSPKTGASGNRATLSEDAATDPAPPRRGLREVAVELWHQPPGARKSKSGDTTAALGKEVVDGLSRQEFMLGVAATVLDLAITVFGYYADKHSKIDVYSREASSLLLAGLVGGALMALGTGMRRRALLGFASFIVGMEMISFAGVQGVIYLAFGGWLIFRVMRKQKQDHAAGRSTATVDPSRRRGAGARSAGGRTVTAPSASKRYTPPRAARAGSGRRR